MIPLYLDLSDKKAVVFGGGPVGQRKAAYLSKEASVTIVDRSDGPCPPGVTRVRAELKDSLDLIRKSDIVVAATDSYETYDIICREARARGKMFNRADGNGTFLIPSLVERRNFSVAVSTEGRSPGMSKILKDHIDKQLPPEWEQMVDLMEKVRQALKDSVPDQRRRETVLRALTEDREVWRSLSFGTETAFQLAMRKAVTL